MDVDISGWVTVCMHMHSLRCVHACKRLSSVYVHALVASGIHVCVHMCLMCMGTCACTQE